MSCIQGISLRDEQVALNCPKIGDRWSEMMANQIYICAVDPEFIKVLFLWGGGRRAYMFETVGDFQDWIMYSSAPVRGIEGWTWCNFLGNSIKHCEDDPTWESQWNDQAKLTGVEHPGDYLK